MKHLRLSHTSPALHTTLEGVVTKSSRVLTRSVLKTLLAIEALFFGTLSRLILQSSLLFFLLQSEEGPLF